MVGAPPVGDGEEEVAGSWITSDDAGGGLCSAEARSYVTWFGVAWIDEVVRGGGELMGDTVLLYAAADEKGSLTPWAGA